MPELCLLAEKTKAMGKMSGFLGGKSGTFNGHSYLFTSAQGHLLEYPDPTKMLRNPKLASQYTWHRKSLWNPQDFKWNKVPKSDKAKRMIKNIAAAAHKCRAIVICTDNDPSGEGDVLGYEIVRYIGWKGPVYRIRFSAVTEGEFKTALKKMSNMNLPKNHGILTKGVGRGIWDYMSIQLTRHATTDVRVAGFRVHTVNEGRLKSVILCLIYNRLQARKNYVRHPYFEVQFRDDNGYVYSRKMRNDNDKKRYRHQSQQDCQEALQQYHPSAVGNIEKSKRTQAPGPLLNLADLGARLDPLGFSPENVQNTYQKMYEDNIVSYPRTEDEKITKEQFDDLLPHVNQIADVVGVDKSLLTHRTPRKKHLTKHADHGANRPGTTVPSSLNALKKYGNAGPYIYKTLAKNYLAILCEDYVYTHVTANLKDYPQFSTSFNKPVQRNYKTVFDNSSKRKKGNYKPLGQTANPIIHEGSNPKPGKPRLQWVYNYLEHKKVGTGATQENTMVKLEKGKSRKIKDYHSNLSLTPEGVTCAVMARGTYISNADITKQLSNIMDQVQKGQRSLNYLVGTANQVVKHDVPIFRRNVAYVRLPKTANTRFSVNVGGTAKSVNRMFSGHRFTDDEVQKLKSGQSIVMRGIKAKGMKWIVKGKLGINNINNRKYFGFCVEQFRPDVEMITMADGSGRQMKRVFSGHRFTDQEANALAHGETIAMHGIKAKGKKWFVKGKAGLNQYKGKKYFGFCVEQFRPDVEMITMADGSGRQMKRVFCGHRFTDQEADALAHGKTIVIHNVKAKGQLYKVTGKAGACQYNNHKYFGFVVQKFEFEHPVEKVKAANGATFKRKFGGHRFTDNEVKELLAGKTITIKLQGRNGSYTMTGKLAWQVYNGHKFYGFKKVGDSSGGSKKAAQWKKTRSQWPKVQVGGKLSRFRPAFGGKKFTVDQINKLCAGKTIKVVRSNYKAEGKLAWYNYKGRKHFGFKVTKWL